MVSLGRITPILRIFDEAKAREFYIDFLGVAVDWEHRFEPGLPLYMQISKDDCILHLSEHHRRLLARRARANRNHRAGRVSATTAGQAVQIRAPMLRKHPWGTREMTIGDPFGNSLTFWMPCGK